MFFLEILISWFLVGLIWVIQLVHYPSFAYVNVGDFSEFHSFHSSRISILVVPLMISELVLSFYLLQQNFSIFRTIILVLVILIWCSTFFLSVPIHNQLAIGKDDNLIRSLVITNWFRTILWTLKGILITLVRFF